MKMALTKVPYTDDVTVINADNLNNIQDEIINQCITGEIKSFTDVKKNAARTTIGIPNVSTGETIALADLTATIVESF